MCGWSPDLVRALERASAEDGTTWPDYLTESEIAFRESNRRIRQRVAVLPPGQGVPPLVKRVILREFSFVEGEEPLRIRWTKFTNDDFVEVDRQDRTLWLNSLYREAVLSGSSAGVNDGATVEGSALSPLRGHLQGHAIGPKDKDNMNVWMEILTAAAEDELMTTSARRIQDGIYRLILSRVTWRATSTGHHIEGAPSLGLSLTVPGAFLDFRFLPRRPCQMSTLLRT